MVAAEPNLEMQSINTSRFATTI